MMSRTYANSTLYGISNKAERYIWGIWLVLIFISCLIGHTAILLAAVRYNAFKLHKFIVVCIEHIAISDLLMAVVIFFRMGSIFVNGWIFGERFENYVFVHFQYLSTMSSLYLICFMTSCKLWILTFPLKPQTLQKKTAHMFCAVLWALNFALPFSHLIDNKGNVRWDYRLYALDFAYDQENAGLTETVMTFAMMIPSTVVTITSVLLVKHLLSSRRVTNRVRGSIRWQGIVAVIAVAGVYMAASIPLTIAYLIPHFEPDFNLKTYTVAIRTTTTLFYLNTMANFFIYYFTVKSFRGFIKQQMQRMVVLMSGESIF